MYHAESDTPARVRTMNLNEDLGQVGDAISSGFVVGRGRGSVVDVFILLLLSAAALCENHTAERSAILVTRRSAIAIRWSLTAISSV